MRKITPPPPAQAQGALQECIAQLRQRGFVLSDHAAARMQARCIPWQCILFLLDYGHREDDGGYCLMHLRTQHKRNRFQNWAKEKCLAVQERPFFVMQDERVIVAVGWHMPKAAMPAEAEAPDTLQECIAQLRQCGIVLTEHAAIRVQKRCIPWQCIPYLLDNGHSENDGGHRIVHLRSRDKKEKFRLWADGMGISMRELPYLVIRDECVIITAGWRYKKVLHNNHSKRGRKWHR